MIDIFTKQNEKDSLDMLAAQKQLYSDSKCWLLSTFTFGVVIPFALIVLSFLLYKYQPSFYCGIESTIETVKIFYGIFATIFVEVGSFFYICHRAKATQIREYFDVTLFDFDWNFPLAGDKPDLEDICRPKNKYLKKNGLLDDLLDWYHPEAKSIDYPQSIITCQKQNICWDSFFRSKMIRLYVGGLVSIVLFCIWLGWLEDISLKEFVIQFIPCMLPITLYAVRAIFEQINSNMTLKNLKVGLRDINVTDLQDNVEEIKKQARYIQDGLYIHRKYSRPIPDLLHKCFKAKLEEETKEIIMKEKNKNFDS